MGKILLIDHDESQAQQLSEALEAQGHEVILVDQDADGLAQARSTAPHCIVLAVELNNFSGYSVCNKIKRDRELAAIPLLLVSAQASAETFAEHSRLKTHAEAYAHKPYDVAAIEQTVATLLASPALAARARGQQAPAAEPEPHAPAPAEPASAPPTAPRPARFGEEPSAYDISGAPFLAHGPTAAATENQSAYGGNPLPAHGSAQVHYSTDAQVLLESAVDTHDATRVFDNFVLGEGHQGSASPAELIVEALGDIDKAAARASAAELALRSTQELGIGLELPVENLADSNPGEVGHEPSSFETHLVDALRARVAELEQNQLQRKAADGEASARPHGALLDEVAALKSRCQLAEAGRDEALAQLEAQQQTLAQIRSLLQHVGRS